MGGLHPRIKKMVEVRLAQAARGLVYNITDVVWTGPVLSGCTVGNGTQDGQQPNIPLHFREDLLGNDAVMVLDPMHQGIDLTDLLAQWMDPNKNMDIRSQLGASSPFEIEINGNSTHEGDWLSMSVQGK
jgi:hypothetical protein